MRTRALIIVALVVCGAFWVPCRADEEERKLVRHRSDHFDIYARNEDVASEREVELEKAAAQFKDLIGVEPVRGAIILEPRAMMPGLVKQILDGIKSGGGVAPVQVAPAPIQLDAADYRRYMTDGAEYVLPWCERMVDEEDVPTEGLGAQIAGQVLAQIKSQVNALSHEAGHFMLMHWAEPNPDAASASEYHYGSALMPDWFDEAVAVYLEPEEMKETRRGLMKANLKQNIPFERFFTMEHPAAGLEKELIERTNRSESTALPDGPAGLDQEAGTVFYPQVLAVLEFFIELGGKEFVRKMAETFRDGGEIGEALENLPPDCTRDLAKLEKKWIAWVKKNYKAADAFGQLAGLLPSESGVKTTKGAKGKEAPTAANWFGAALEDSEPTLKHQLDFGTSEELVLVADIDEESHAFAQGLRSYDIISEIISGADRKRATLEQLLGLAKSHTGGEVTLGVVRRGKAIQVIFELPGE
ncbi:MAG: hypothetical protein RDV41_15555 [Planctomycetota bacterium]|nr:hypothetical protein [Planctomycetota bacterium]